MAISTYRRPESLRATLRSIDPGGPGGERQRHPVDWTLAEVLVVDNDPAGSAQDVVRAFACDHAVPVRYVREPNQGLATARNRALDEASTDVLVFIDDDETAQPGWPGGLIQVMVDRDAGLVGGPVRTEFLEDPPAWVVEGRFFARPEPADGADQSWLRSGNLAIDLAKIRAAGVRFDSRFDSSGGEDVAFSRVAHDRGLGLRWSAEAAVTELVGPERTTVRWLARRERRSTTNWVRVEVGLDRSSARKLLIIARGAARLLQGATAVVVGLATLRSSRVVAGLVTASRGVGSFEGLADRRFTDYG